MSDSYNDSRDDNREDQSDEEEVFELSNLLSFLQKSKIWRRNIEIFFRQRNRQIFN